MTLRDSDFQLFLDLGLCLAKNVFDDALAGFRVVACGVAAFPTPVCTLADVALAVGALLSQMESLLSW